MKISEYCREDRPREKLMERGPRALSNGELLAILLRTGGGGENVLELAQRLLSLADGGLVALSAMSSEALCRVRGIGPDKAATVLAAFELGRRWAAEPPDIAKVAVKSSSMAYRIVAPRLKALDHEELWLMLLNRSNYVLGLEMVTSGALTATSVDVQRIVRRAIDKNATAAIIFHNHPSDNPMPGKEDIEITAMVRDALETFQKQLLDHIVTASGSYYSFAEEKIIPTFVPGSSKISDTDESDKSWGDRFNPQHLCRPDARQDNPEGQHEIPPQP